MCLDAGMTGGNLKGPFSSGKSESPEVLRGFW